MTIVALLIPLLVGLCAFLFALSLLPSPSPLTLTLDALEARSRTANADKANNPLERVLSEIISPDRTGKLQRKLLEAGWYNLTPPQLVLRMLAGVCAGLAIAIFLGNVLHVPPLLLIAFQLIALVGATLLPLMVLERAIEARKLQVQSTLPDFLDMIASTVQAGLSVNAALAYSVDAAPGALGDEIKECLAEIRLGRGKAEALKAAAYRLNQQEFTTTVAAITQAERLGANIGKVLSELAQDTRNHRIMAVEEHAAKLPVKMVIPMAFFLLPALFTIIFGTLAANYFAQAG